MSAVKSSLIHPRYKTEYRVGNWRKYEEGRRARGDLTTWFSEEAIANWISRVTGARGGQRLYSNLGIETSLTPRTVFGLALRQTEGFVGSLLRLLGLGHLPVPDHSTLSGASAIKCCYAASGDRWRDQPTVLPRSNVGAGAVGAAWRLHF